ncbi:MAG TPA: LysE family transporter [Candidatus Sulfotelmatobacter sp.]|nr:LysE family transporter [Candidatus Sulfotelmatobacter sp.]
MLTSAIAGALAGLGIAVPVGAIAVLIITTAASRGLAVGLAAGAGAASADGLYAALAALSGAALSGVIAPWLGGLRVVAALALALIGGGGLWRAWQGRRAASALEDPPSPPARTGSAAGATYARFLGLTLLNPVTVIYFAALMVALPAVGAAPAERLAFAAGAFLASLGWQSVLAVIGGILHRRSSPAARTALSVVGCLIILGFAVRIGAQALFGS